MIAIHNEYQPLPSYLEAHMITLHNLGYPRIGRDREMKFATERYWKGRSDIDQLLSTAAEVRRERWRTQAEAGVTYLPIGDFPFYDHVLQTSMLLGVVPERFRNSAVAGSSHDLTFAIARGIATPKGDIEPAAMTKWFDTNYHYIVPELDRDSVYAPDATSLVEEAREARSLGYNPKPVLLGPLSFLRLAGATPDNVVPIAEAYAKIVDELAPHAQWLQFDEPILALDLDESWHNAFRTVYAILARARATLSLRLLVATYFGSLDDNLTLLTDLPVEGVHLDAVRAPDELTTAVEHLTPEQVLSVGIIDGRNIWRNNLEASIEVLVPLYERLGDRLWIAPSCSLLHVPVDVGSETDLDPTVRATLAFADQKLQELGLLKSGLEQGSSAIAGAIIDYRENLANRSGERRTDISVDEESTRRGPYALRRRMHAERFSLPLFPTTTIGSFPQTAEIRRTRRAYRTGDLSQEEYTKQLQQEIERTVRKQEEIGLDVIVHGETERTDMVEYFGQQLEGFAFTRNGWVQSYGTRCVKPPIIHGDVNRRGPMTVFWSSYAQSLTDRPVKGMLTGPITILQWSFVREDQPRRDTALQIAAALREEVCNLERAGIGMIQVDEPALREGLPLRRSGWNEYLEWATLAFRFATSGVTNQTQIHTHMCYSEFNDIIEAIAAMDADVITIEAARSKMHLLDAFERFSYPNQIGPGIYDIHSPLIPTVENIVELLNRALERIPAERLWVNPDCGLKTRSWDEVEPALRNMVTAARRVRAARATGEVAEKVG